MASIGCLNFAVRLCVKLEGCIIRCFRPAVVIFHFRKRFGSHLLMACLQ
jgi:hypothetical protein